MTSHHGQRLDPKNDTTASTDFGDVTYALPACHPGFVIPCPVGDSNHTAGFAAAAREKGAHGSAMKVAGGLAGVGMRVLGDEEWAEEVGRVWREWKEGTEGK